MNFPRVSQVAIAVQYIGNPKPTVYTDIIGSNHGSIARNHDIDMSKCECGFIVEGGGFANRFDALICAIYNNQLNESGMRFLAQRLHAKQLDTHPGLDSGHLKYE